MKKFLSMLLALSVVFTYTFGAAGSVFATDTPKYNVDEQKTLLANAYNAAIAEAAGYNYDFDSKLYTGTTADNDLTMVAISADAVKAGIATAYDAVLADITDGTKSIETKIPTAKTGDYNATSNNTTTSTDFVAVKKYLLDSAKAGGDQKDVVLKAAFADFKAYLTSIVDGVDIKDYTSTVQTTKYTAKDGEKYDTAAKAAAADIAYAKAVISHAKLKNSKTPASDESDWNVTTFNELYAEIVGADKVIKVVENKDDAINENYVTSLTYKLVAKDTVDSRDYATTKSEAADEANKAVTQASAKAALIAAITTFENANTLKADAQAQLDAYKEAKIYLIENAGTFAGTYAITKVEKDGVTATEGGEVKAKDDFVELSDAAKAAKADVDVQKAYNVARGYNWDDAEATKALKAQLVAIYGGSEKANLDTTKVISSDLTAGARAAKKVDYSEIEAEKYASTMTGVTSYQGKAFVYNKKAYYAKEWDAVKAILDKYNTAVDEAKVMADITGSEGAEAVRDAAIAKIETADVVYGKVDDATETYDSLKAYAGLAFKNAKAADKTLQKIYVSFGEDADTITANEGTGLTDSKVYLWAIEKGARSAKEVAALYTEACKVIDGYKTLNDVKADAAAVQAAIAAIPAKAALGDKAAVVAAYDAYQALPTDGKNYVTNYTALKSAIAAVEKAEAYDVKAKIDALPKEAKVVAADKAAVEAAKKAFNDYDKTTAYAALTSKTLRDAGYNFTTALTNARTDAENAIKVAFNALNNKYVADKLTAEDAEAVKALQAAIDAYVADYNASPAIVGVTSVEKELAKIAAVVEKAVEETKYTDKDAKADFLDMARKVTIWRTSKKSIRVTAVGSVSEIKENGYTVKYTFYKKAPGAKAFKAVKTTTSNKFVYKNLKKGTNKFQVKVKVYDAEGKLVASKTTFYRVAKVK